MSDARAIATTIPTRKTSDDSPLNLRSLRDGSLVVVSQLQALALEGRCFLAFAGVEDAPIDISTTADDQVGFIAVDVAAGTTVIPYFAQAVIAVWSDISAINFMLEVDNAKNRINAGTSFTPLNLRTDSPITSTSTVARSLDADVMTLLAKTAGGSLEIYRESIEINMGDAADYWPKFEYNPKVYPVVIGPAAVIVHFGNSDGITEATGYGCIQWAEVPTTSID